MLDEHLQLGPVKLWLGRRGGPALTLALPLTVGLSVSDYYEEGPGGDNDTFGYFDGGIVASVPLAFVPADYGSWSASASFDVLALSGTLARANRGDGTFFVGKGGLAMTY